MKHHIAIAWMLLLCLIFGGCGVTPPVSELPDTADPMTIVPETTPPETTPPETTPPETTPPETTPPETTPPETTPPETTPPETTPPETTPPETTPPETTPPETTPPETTPPETTPPETTPPETTPPETTPPETIPPETIPPETTPPETTPPETTPPEIIVPDGVLHIADGTYNYTMIRPASAKKAVRGACETLRDTIGGDLTLTTDEESQADTFEILLGNTNRPESAQLAEGLGESDYRIAVVGEKLVVAGGSDLALQHAVRRLMKDIDGGTLPRDYGVFFDGAEERADYLADPERFLVNWVMDFDVPDWMRDFEEKKAAFADTDGRLMSSFHRGDIKNYPENSLEAIISAIHAGADNIEIDVYKTKDGVLVLMHEPTLDRCTDYYRKKGKDGLPTSNTVTDWTFEQLRQLRLVHGGRYTEYVIPTLEEVLTVCRGRTTIRLDRVEQWDWDADIYPLVRKTEAWEALVLSNSEDDVQMRQIRQLQDGGADCVYGLRNFPHTHTSNWWQYHLRLSGAGHPYILHWSGFQIKEYRDYLTSAAVFTDAYKDECRIHALCHNAEMENAEVWDTLYENGVDFIMVDNGVALCRYIAENFAPTEY